MCGYRIAGKLPKGEFKRLTACVVDFDKGITIIFNQPLPLSLLNLAEREETYWNWYYFLFCHFRQ
jgi:hypothetical protein